MHNIIILFNENARVPVGSSLLLCLLSLLFLFVMFCFFSPFSWTTKFTKILTLLHMYVCFFFFCRIFFPKFSHQITDMIDMYYVRCTQLNIYICCIVLDMHMHICTFTNAYSSFVPLAHSHQESVLTNIIIIIADDDNNINCLHNS